MKKSLLKKNILSAVIFAGAISSVDGQTEPDFLWVKKAGGKNLDEARCITVDASGNSYIGGGFQDTATFGNTTLISNTLTDADAFIAKLDGNGNFLWVIKAGGNFEDRCTAISNDAAGNCYAVGFFKSDSLYIGNQKIKNNGGGRSVFITKIDANGNIQWVKTGRGIDANAIYTNASGISYIVGNFDGAVEFDRYIPAGGGDDIFVLKIDANGNYLSTKTAGGIGDDNAYGIHIDSELNWSITGYYGGAPIKFFKKGGGMITLANSGTYDGFVAKLDSIGYCFWAMSFPVTRYNNSRGQCISGDGAGNTYVVGSFQDTITIGTIQLTSPKKFGNVAYDAFIAKIDTGGNVLWAKHIDETNTTYPYYHGLYTDVSGNSYVAGYNKILKIATNGDSLWTKEILNNSGVAHYQTECRGIDFDASGNCYVAGRFADPSTFGNTSIVSNGQTDVFVTKLDNTGNEVGISDISKTDFSIYPNPAGNLVTLTNLSNNTSVNITDLAGKQVYSATANATELSINTSGFANGVYLVNVTNNGAVATKKLVINK